MCAAIASSSRSARVAPRADPRATSPTHRSPRTGAVRRRSGSSRARRGSRAHGLSWPVVLLQPREHARGVRRACAGARSPADRPIRGVDADALALADEYVAHLFARYPEWATIAGYPGADHGALIDNHPEALAAWRAEEERLLARVRALGGIEVGSDAWGALESVREVLESSVGLRACRAERRGVSSAGPSPMAFPTAGWPSWSASLAEVQPIGTPELRRAAVVALQVTASGPTGVTWTCPCWSRRRSSSPNPREANEELHFASDLHTDRDLTRSVNLAALCRRVPIHLGDSRRVSIGPELCVGCSRVGRDAPVVHDLR